jgi:hypothetical protein
MVHALPHVLFLKAVEKMTGRALYLQVPIQSRCSGPFVPESQFAIPHPRAVGWARAGSGSGVGLNDHG